MKNIGTDWIMKLNGEFGKLDEHGATERSIVKVEKTLCKWASETLWKLMKY